MPETKARNVQSPTSNAQCSEGVSINGHAYDLEERLLNDAAEIIRLTENPPHTRSGNHVSRQPLRSGTSPLPNHDGAQAAGSRDDFVHKLNTCLKKLRESRRWPERIHRVPLARDPKSIETLILETEAVPRTFAKSIPTAGAGGVGR